MRIGSKKRFFGALPVNLNEYLDSLDRIFVLTVNPAEHLHLLQTLNAHQHGQSEYELRQRVAGHDKLVAKLIAKNATPIDTSRPIDVIVTDIITQVKTENYRIFTQKENTPSDNETDTRLDRV